MPNSRLIYVSTAVKNEENIRDDLMDIISQAVNFNAKNEIYGVLYYGLGYFLQCIEGDSAKLKMLYENRLLKDNRHTKVTLLSFESIDQIQFLNWHMKFAPYNKDIMQIFNQKNNSEFNPYLLDEHLMPAFLKLLADAA